jgi:pimeloyl-ACP methyl ester carboxylesterase
MPDAERTRLLAGHGDRAAAEETLRKITARPLPDDLFATTIADMLRTSAPAWHAWLEHGSREDISAAVSSVDAPVFIAVGAADQTITAALVKDEIAGRLKSAPSIRTIGGAGHLLPIEAPSSIANYIFECVSFYQSASANAGITSLARTSH